MKNRPNTFIYKESIKSFARSSYRSINKLLYRIRLVIMRLFNRKQEGKQDQETELKGKQVKCKECGMQFESKERLKVHSKRSSFRKGRKEEKNWSIMHIINK